MSLPVEPVAPLTARRLLAILARTQTEGRIPSVAAGIIRDGALVWSSGYGDVPGDHLDVQYKIGSITKTMTAVLILQLVAEGRLSLEDTAGSVLGDVGYGDRTMRSLLAHNSGMQAEPNGPWWERSEGGTFEDLAAANDGSDAVLPVGEQFHYTNLAYGLLGEIVARLRGGTWWENVQSKILHPLGMERTSYQAVAPHAQGFSIHPWTGEAIAEPHPDTGAMAPAGQLWSTVADLTRYAQFLLDGHDEVLDKAHLEAAYIPQSGTLAGGLSTGHALGFQLFAGGSGTLIGHTGSMPGFVATCFVDRARRTGVVAFGNAMSGLPAVAIAVDLLVELESSEPTLPAPWRPSVDVPATVREIVGTWHWGPTPFQFTWESGELVARKAGVVAYRYRLDGDRWVGTAGYQLGEELRIVRNDDGTINHLNLATFIFTRVPYDPAAPIPGGHPG
ncbi:serine hydrolase domain-containing protein [Nocardioides sp. AE5]|uniref:serine hydrolase domain-containing protein n=1 Tax=Nocardioides sp. AE5 TaxID=2962573 RepID=UPI00288203FE|nr:serine hydrolase domain-containing protein [Nocardioides sp. AE5]MDT0201595.1 serine hydrolase domain-containing protein [Nocardioides sp. AE5]